MSNCQCPDPIELTPIKTGVIKAFSFQSKRGDGTFRSPTDPNIAANVKLFTLAGKFLLNWTVAPGSNNQFICTLSEAQTLTLVPGREYYAELIIRESNIIVQTQRLTFKVYKILQ